MTFSWMRPTLHKETWTAISWSVPSPTSWKNIASWCSVKSYSFFPRNLIRISQVRTALQPRDVLSSGSVETARSAKTIRGNLLASYVSTPRIRNPKSQDAPNQTISFQISIKVMKRMKIVKPSVVTRPQEYMQSASRSSEELLVLVLLVLVVGSAMV